MKNSIKLITALGFICVLGCKKEEPKITITPPPIDNSSYFKIANQTFNAPLVPPDGSSGGGYVLTASQVNSITDYRTLGLTFSSEPTQARKIKVQFGAAIVGMTYVTISYAVLDASISNSQDIYLARGLDIDSVSVSFDAQNKMVVEIPTMSLVKQTNTTVLSTLSLSGRLKRN